MKKSFIAILFGVMLNPTFLFAGSGTAIMPHFYVNLLDGTDPAFELNYLYITNITNHDLIVSVICSDKNGTAVETTSFVYNNFLNGNTVIKAKNTAYIVLRHTGWRYGICTIGWSNEGADQDAKGLIAHGIRLHGNINGYSAIPINGGLPF